MARYIAKNIVASGIAKTAKVELSYVIGVPEPSSMNIDLGNAIEGINIDALKKWIQKKVNLTPYGIMTKFNYSFPRNQFNEIWGFYGVDVNKNRNLEKFYPWETIDLADEIAEEFK